MPKEDLLQPRRESFLPPWTQQMRVGRHTSDRRPCPGCCIEQLREDAEVMAPAFEVIFEHLKDLTLAYDEPIRQWKKAKRVVDGQEQYVFRAGPGNNRHVLLPVEERASRMGPNKKAPRIEQKCTTKYRERARKSRLPPARYINDAVRGSLVYPTCQAMLSAVKRVQRHERLGLPYEDGFVAYEVMRAKQIFHPVSSLVYGDIKLNLRVFTHDRPRGHNCELQIHHMHMIEGKGRPAGHGAYVTWRDLDDEHWAEHNAAMPVQIADMPSSYAGRARRAIAESHSAYRTAEMSLKSDREFKRLVAYVDRIRSRPNHTV